MDIFTPNIDYLINKNKNMISEIDAIIQGLSDIHREINQVEGYICVTHFHYIICVDEWGITFDT